MTTPSAERVRELIEHADAETRAASVWAERIEADRFSYTSEALGEARKTERVNADTAAALRIALAVLDPSEATVERVARGVFTENGYWRYIGGSARGGASSPRTHPEHWQSVAWEETDADDRDSRLKEARAAIAALAKA